MENLTWLDLIWFFLWLITIRHLFLNKEKNNIKLSKVNPATSVVPVKLEIFSAQVYVWNADNDEFIAQGKDTETALNKALSMYPNNIYKIVSKETFE
ncbi:MAG: hypothetical protein EB127_02475 [Alphaproteobacteria bacterium]|nr:hypothetical protein [Alphaproteobacteria bacterium]